MTTEAVARARWAMMPADRWKAINYLYRWSMRPLNTQQAAPATVAALGEVGVSRDVLARLERGGYVRGRHGDTEVGLAGGDPDTTVVELTRAGIRWWNSNPYNRALQAAHGQSSRLLVDLLLRGLDPGAVEAIVTAGYAELVCDLTGPVRYLNAASLRSADRIATWRMRTTRRGRQLLTPAREG